MVEEESKSKLKMPDTETLLRNTLPAAVILTLLVGVSVWALFQPIEIEGTIEFQGIVNADGSTYNFNIPDNKTVEIFGKKLLPANGSISLNEVDGRFRVEYKAKMPWIVAKDFFADEGGE